MDKRIIASILSQLIEAREIEAPQSLIDKVLNNQATNNNYDPKHLKRQSKIHEKIIYDCLDLGTFKQGIPKMTGINIGTFSIYDPICRYELVAKELFEKINKFKKAFKKADGKGDLFTKVECLLNLDNCTYDLHAHFVLNTELEIEQIKALLPNMTSEDKTKYVEECENRKRIAKYLAKEWIQTQSKDFISATNKTGKRPYSCLKLEKKWRGILKDFIRESYDSMKGKSIYAYANNYKAICREHLDKAKAESKARAEKARKDFLEDKLEIGTDEWDFAMFVLRNDRMREARKERRFARTTTNWEEYFNSHRSHKQKVAESVAEEPKKQEQKKRDPNEPLVGSVRIEKPKVKRPMESIDPKQEKEEPKVIRKSSGLEFELEKPVGEMSPEEIEAKLQEIKAKTEEIERKADRPKTKEIERKADRPKTKEGRWVARMKRHGYDKIFQELLGDVLLLAEKSEGENKEAYRFDLAQMGRMWNYDKMEIEKKLRRMARRILKQKYITGEIKALLVKLLELNGLDEGQIERALQGYKLVKGKKHKSILDKMREEWRAFDFDRNKVVAWLEEQIKALEQPEEEKEVTGIGTEIKATENRKEPKGIKYTLRLGYEAYGLYIALKVQESNKSPPCFMFLSEKIKMEGEEEMKRINKKREFKGIGENRPPPKFSLGCGRWLKQGVRVYISKGIPLQTYKKERGFQVKVLEKNNSKNL